MTSTPPDSVQSSTATACPPNWYPDPWAVAPWRWWDGRQWTPVIYGPYGEAWPLTQASMPFVSKGPGIRAGGIAAIGAGAGVVGTVVVVIAFLVATSGHLNANDPWYLLTSQLALWIGFMGAVVVASRVNGTRSLARDYGLSLPRWGDLWTGLAGGIIARILPFIFLVIVVLAGNGFSQPNSVAPKVLGTTPQGVSGWAIVIVLSVIGAPLVEELFFRGLIQGAFTRRIGPVPAIFVTALIFSVAHIFSEGPFAPFVLFPAALVLGYLRHRSGRLAPGMIAHATFNASLFLLFLIPAFR